jgi:Uma2 family endonuclease
MSQKKGAYMALQEQLYTNEAFWEFVELPENADKNFELYEGVPFEMPSPSPLHGLIVTEILFLIRTYLATYNIGYALGDGYDFTLAPRIIFKPDVSFISKERLPQIPKRFEIAPDIAVEVVSPSNTVDEILYKVETYIQYGTQLVWVIYPDKRLVYVYRPAEDNSLNLRKLTVDDRLDGGKVLPEFSAPVAKIFPAAS